MLCFQPCTIHSLFQQNFLPDFYVMHFQENTITLVTEKVIVQLKHVLKIQVLKLSDES